jgi:hypothetical protein
LTGFIAQSGGNLEVLRKQNAGECEPWYEWRQKINKKVKVETCYTMSTNC